MYLLSKQRRVRKSIECYVYDTFNNRHFQLNPILIWEFDMVVRIFF